MVSLEIVDPVLHAKTLCTKFKGCDVIMLKIFRSSSIVFRHFISTFRALKSKMNIDGGRTKPHISIFCAFKNQSEQLVLRWIHQSQQLLSRRETEMQQYLSYSTRKMFALLTFFRMLLFFFFSRS